MAEQKKAALNQRRVEQETPEWKKQYAKRSGVEGVHEALERKTGIKNLKVRGIQAVAMAVFFKVTGWNICAAAKIALKRRKKKELAAEKPKISLNNVMKRPKTARGARRRTSPGPLPKFSRLDPEKNRAGSGRVKFEISFLRPHLGAKFWHFRFS